MMLNF